MTLPHVATLRRMSKAGTKYTYTNAGTLKCFLQPLDMTSAETYGITFAKGSACYVPLTADVTESDELVIDGVTYGVKGMKTHNYGNLAHRKLMLEAV